MKLDLQMLSKIISVPVEKEHNPFTSAEFNKILILCNEN